MNSKAETAGVGCYIFGILVILSMIPAWVTHVIWIIMKLASDSGATAGQIALGVIGAFFPPAGVIHGFMIWFGIGF